MSLLNDITKAVGLPTTYGSPAQPTLAAGQQPGGPSAAEQLRDRFGGTVSTEFSSNLAVVLERGARGEWDDRTLALEEQAALQRLRDARRQAESGGGATGAPAPVPTGGANAAPDTSSIAVQEQRAVYDIRVRQSEARLRNISASLASDFPLAAQLTSASSGTWDPETFVPRTREEAMAFAHRLVIDATESAARLEIVKTQLDAARFELAHGGGAAVQAKVGELEAAYGRQVAYVEKLAKIVDRQSGGQFSSAGRSAMQGNTMRDAGDLPVAEIAAALRERGMSEEQIARVLGAGEMAVEQEKLPGGSERLKQVASDMTRTLLTEFNQRVERMREDSRRQEEQRAQERKLRDRRSERKRADRRHVEERIDQRRGEQQRQEQVQDARRAQADAQFQQWIQSLSQQAAQRRRTG